jgi:hypothetical protein
MFIAAWVLMIYTAYDWIINFDVTQHMTFEQ